MPSRCVAMLALLVASPAGAVPGAATSDVPWLPLTTPTISVRLAPGPVPDELVPILSQGWRVGADTVERVEQLRRADPSLPDPTRVWRVPASALPVLRGNPAVEAVWGHPPPAEPPDDPADIPPTTPDFEDQQQWLPTFGLSATQWWPGGDGAAVRVYDVEYDILEAHEDLANNPIAALSGDPLGQYLNHGTSVAGIVAASDDGFGTTGGAPAAEVLIVYPMQQGRYDVASAILQAMDDGRPGDVVLIEQQIGSDFGLVAVSADPVTWEAIRLATAAGLVVVEPAGNGGVDLDDPGWGGWWAADNDSGAIVVGAADPATGGPAVFSGFGGRVDVHGWGLGIVAPSTGEYDPDLFWPDRDERQAYTSSFGGTSGASAQVASMVASVQGIHEAVHGEPIEPHRLRAWMIASGHPQARSDGAESHIGVRPDLRRLARTWLAP